MGRSALYGNRWKTLRAIGQGGQAQVFLVVDNSSELEGEFALKRLMNVNRRDRFTKEIEAVKQLDHPNIVSLIDHSALDAEDATPFIVMPLAAGGDLSTRVAAFKGAVEPTATVALQLAEALRSAHERGIIHRDIKPANILFKDTSLDVWLTDFGICLLRDASRDTDAHEVVGPRGGYMAPECEDGGQLDVSTAADVYSLGKVIYFMLSGGRALPRERLDDPSFALEFIEGQRALFMQTLLRKMICPLEKRISSMDDVATELSRILNWRPPTTAAVSERAKALLDKHAQKINEADRIREENAAARQAEHESAKLVIDGFGAWIENELEQITSAMQSGSSACEVQDLPHQSRLTDVMGPTRYDIQREWRLAYYPSDKDRENHHLLRVYLCEKLPAAVRFREDPRSLLPERVPVRDLEFTMIGAYAHSVSLHSYSDIQGFYSCLKLVGTDRLRLPTMTTGSRSVDVMRVRRIMKVFDTSYSQHLSFSASQWPVVMQQLHSILGEFVEAFAEEISDPSETIGY